MRDLVTLTNHLAERFPDAAFVYRPHPFERLETYKEMLGSHQNLHLVKEGSLELNLEDEITRETLVTHGGEVVQPRMRGLLGLPERAPGIGEDNADG